MFQSLDMNNSGKIDYTEFLAMFTQNPIYQTEQNFKEIFQKLDLDRDGKVTELVTE